MPYTIELLLLVKTYITCRDGDSSGTGVKRVFKSAADFSRILCKDIVRKGIELTFKATTLNNYFKKFKQGDLSVLSTGQKIPGCLAKYCGYESFEDFESRPVAPADHEIKLALKEMKLEVFLEDQQSKLMKDSPCYIPFQKFEDLEFQERNVEINCITANLHWPRHFFSKKLDEISKTNNRYRYILTETSGDLYRGLIEQQIKSHGLGDRIMIRSLHDSKTKLYPSFSNIPLPIANDIVLYRRMLASGQSFAFYMGIIGTQIDHDFHKGAFAFKIEDIRAMALLNWFDEVWEILGKNKRSA